MTIIIMTRVRWTTRSPGLPTFNVFPYPVPLWASVMWMGFSLTWMVFSFPLIAPASCWLPHDSLSRPSPWVGVQQGLPLGTGWEHPVLPKCPSSVLRAMLADAPSRAELEAPLWALFACWAISSLRRACARNSDHAVVLDLSQSPQQPRL